MTGVKKIAEKVQNNELAADEIDEETIRKSLMTASVYPYDDPDLLIRTSGEERISNFLLWQLAYSEMVFTDTFGLDYSPADLGGRYQQISTTKSSFRRSERGGQK